jgi:hypothetical protein
MGGLLGPAWGMSGWGAGVGKVIRGHPRPDERVQLSLPCIMMRSRYPWEIIPGYRLLMQVRVVSVGVCQLLVFRIKGRSQVSAKQADSQKPYVSHTGCLFYTMPKILWGVTSYVVFPAPGCRMAIVS